MFTIETLKEYKAKYEKELLFAQAKLQVVEDMLIEAEYDAAREAEEQANEVADPAEQHAVEDSTVSAYN